jgi:signal-transduction protein with cAMP-binding, CBS, and nucleotidyltransferase domain
MNESVSVREVMDRAYVGVSESDDLLETTELLVREEASTALVLRGNDPIGVVTETDILGYVVSDGEPEAAAVGDVMTESVPSISPDARLTEARDRMAAWSTEWILVVEDGDPVGTLTGHDILSTARLESESTEQVADDGRLVTTAEAATTDGAPPQSDESVDEQGICGGCGTLTQSLASVNGQVLCADCREV